MKINWFNLVIGLVVFIVATLAIGYTATQMQGPDVSKVAFYGLILLLIAK